ncbi:MAG TPA: hypothetical protein VGY54_05300, partial [Polyangiaceae bacterium]|nr:hypothetical protein [Polyangiaceae bacterium]
MKTRHALVALVGAWWCSSCAPSGFQDSALVQNGVRIFASSASKPCPNAGAVDAGNPAATCAYANPGDTMEITLLAYDGRSKDQKGEPMQVVWLPYVCENPALDTYYSCFAQLGGFFADAGLPVQSQAAQEAGAGDDANSNADSGADAGAGAGADAGAGAGAD